MAPKCSQTIFSPVTKKERQCRRPAGPTGLCGPHQKKLAPGETPKPPPKPKPHRIAELNAARAVIAAAKAWLRDPEMRGRFVAALGDYDDLIGE